MMTWGTLALIGEEKFVQVTRDIIQLRENLQKKLRRIPELKMMGTPQLSVLAFDAKDLNIYQISHKMKEKGWHLNNIQKPAGTHLCLTAKHLEDRDFANRFIRDLEACVAYVKANPHEKLEGDGATYATMAQIPAALSRPLKEEMGREFTYLSSRVRATRGMAQNGEGSDPLYRLRERDRVRV
jgi:glutamate/tyrosine decarboxylase-like PLP-dependent enzyme